MSKIAVCMYKAVLDILNLVTDIYKSIQLRTTLFPYTTLFRSLNAAAPRPASTSGAPSTTSKARVCALMDRAITTSAGIGPPGRSEEHTSELQSRGHLVCRHLREKKKRK